MSRKTGLTLLRLYNEIHACERKIHVAATDCIRLLTSGANSGQLLCWILFEHDTADSPNRTSKSAQGSPLARPPKGIFPSPEPSSSFLQSDPLPKKVLQGRKRPSNYFFDVSPCRGHGWHFYRANRFAASKTHSSEIGCAHLKLVRPNLRKFALVLCANRARWNTEVL